MNNIDAIEALNSLGLSSYPYDEVKRLVSLFAPKFLGIWIPKGHWIERIRPDANVFEQKGMSYRPAVDNKKTQRATLPGKTASAIQRLQDILLIIQKHFRLCQYSKIRLS